MVIFGILGYAMKKLKYPVAPLVLALVLGDMAESSFRQSMLLSDGDLFIFFNSGLSAGITTLALTLLLLPILIKTRQLFRRG
jgi:putative tricarboxylic transport membrane protein